MKLSPSGRWAFRRSFGFVLLACSAVVWTSIAHGETEPSYYIYHGERKRLYLDEGFLAVKLKSESVNGATPKPTLSASLTSKGLTAADVLDSPMPGWSLIKTEKLRGSAVARASHNQSTAASVHGSIHSILESGDANVLFVSPLFRSEKGGPIIITPRLLIGFQPGVTAEARSRLRNTLGQGAEIEKVEFPQPNAERWQSNSRDGLTVLASANALATAPGVAYAEPDFFATGHTNFLPNDPQFSQSWGLRNTGASGGVAGFDMAATSAWSLTLGRPSVLVLILDSGVQENHPDLNVALGRDFTPDSPSHPGGGPFQTFDNHGTWVAGCVSERINNSLGTSGIAPGVRAISARCHGMVKKDGSFSFLFSSVVDALNWGQSIHARISNNSNFYEVTSSAIDQAYNDTRVQGMVHFACVGNEGRPRIDYPSSLPSVNAVASASRNARRSTFSNYGTGLDFVAPGDQIYTTDRTGPAGESNTDYISVNGTSFASPYAAGIAALILSKNPLLTAAQVESRMRHTCTNMGPLGYDTGYGYGFVNAYHAVNDTRLFPINNVQDFDADAKADIVIFRPSTRVWYFSRSTGGSAGVTFGAASDILVPADYDGDGKTDIAVFRPSAGNWYILQSTTGFIRTVHWGGVGDIPRPGDFDGDGRADIAVFRPVNATWYILQSSDGIARVKQFGANGDIPLLGDFDGDGSADLAIFRIVGGYGNWQYVRSSDGQSASAFLGQSGDIPVVGDYDGDGKSDLAVFRPSNGIWFRISSLKGNTYSKQFGINGDQPVAVDYDGDGRTDFAVRRGATFFVLHSTNNFLTTTTFGASSDIVVTATYTR